MRWNVTVNLILVASLWGATGQAYQLRFTPTSAAKAQGNVLVLDVGSLWEKHPADPPFSIATPSQCQQRCAVLPGCNAYSFCSKQAGCGTGCKAHIAQNPQLTLAPAVPNKRGERNDDQHKQLQLPITGFGPFTVSTAAQGCSPSNTDKWAFGTCTLLNAAPGSKATTEAAGDGWVSAWLANPVPSECSCLSAAACAACSSTSNSAACLQCMRDKRAQAESSGAMLVASRGVPGSIGSRMLDQCVTCATVANIELRQKCIACALDSKACSSCVAHPAAASRVQLAAMGTCISCVQARGKRFTGACLTCAVAPDPAKCTVCLDTFYPKYLCMTTTYLDCYKPDFDNPCATCQRGAAQAYTSCIGCYQRPQSKGDCDSCSNLQSATDQQQCYNCSGQVVSAHSDASGGCGVCFAQSSGSATQQQCLQCVLSTGTAAGNKQHCSSCSSSDLSAAQAVRCFSCVASNQGGSGCADCSKATETNAAFASCMACYNNPNNGPDCDDCTSLESTAGQLVTNSLRKQCFDCVVASKLTVPPDAGFAPLGSCSACFAGTGDSALCASCNTSPATSVVAKSWCMSCSAKSSAASRSTCVSCLQSNKFDRADEYMKMCSL